MRNYISVSRHYPRQSYKQWLNKKSLLFSVYINVLQLFGCWLKRKSSDWNNLHALSLAKERRIKKTKREAINGNDRFQLGPWRPIWSHLQNRKNEKLIRSVLYLQGPEGISSEGPGLERLTIIEIYLIQIRSHVWKIVLLAFVFYCIIN